MEGSRIGQTKKILGPETSVRFNHNQYHGTWKTPTSVCAGYTHTVLPKSLDFLEKGTSSLLEFDGEEISGFAEDMMFRLLIQFPEARKSLSESIQISAASGSGGRVHWSRPEREWLFKCLVMEVKEIPSGTEEVSDLRMYLENRPDLFPGALGSAVEENLDSFSGLEDPMETMPSEKKSEDMPLIVDVSIEDDASLTEPIISEISMSIPEIGDDFGDFGQIEGYVSGMGEEDASPPASFTITDDYLDSIPAMEFPSEDELDSTIALDNNIQNSSRLDVPLPDDTSEIDVIKTGSEVVEAITVDLVTENMTLPENKTAVGSLDSLFFDHDNELMNFLNGKSNEPSLDTGDSETKAIWAAQDLYTILQTTSVLQRLQAGIGYMIGQDDKEDRLSEVLKDKRLDQKTNGNNKPTFDKPENKVMSQQELVEYCTKEPSSKGLRFDLQRVQSLIRSNQRATDRIYSLIHADFSDQSYITRGYSWLVNVLRFNEMKVQQWSHIFESKENFRHSEEGVDVLEDIIAMDWNELSDEEEMWEWNKSVDTNHRSYRVDMINERDDECADELMERMEEEWGWAIDDDSNDDENYNEELD
jgi:hypothetical protein